MSIAKRLFDVFRRRKGSPGNKGAVGTANDKRAADKTDFVHGKPAPQPTDSKSSASAKDEKLAPESKRSIGAKESVDEKLATEKTRALSKRQDPVTDLAKNPWPALCYLLVNFDYESAVHSRKHTISGSGFFVSETMVITAAHNLCWFDNGDCLTPTSILIRPSDRKTSTTVKCSPLSTRFATQFEKCLKAGLDDMAFHHDYGAIFLLPGTIKPQPTFCFNVEGTEPEDPHWDRPLMFGGYSQAETSDPFVLSSAEVVATPKSEGRFRGEANNVVRHGTRSRRGQSGGPLFALADNRVVGIQVGALADADFVAVRISRDMVQLFKSWEREYMDSPEFRKEDLIA